MLWNGFTLKWVWDVAAFDRSSKGPMKIFSERKRALLQRQRLAHFCCCLGCVLRWEEQKEPDTTLTTQVDPQELSNKRYGNLPKSNFAAPLKLNVGIIQWSDGAGNDQVVRCGLGMHRLLLDLIDLAFRGSVWRFNKGNYLHVLLEVGVTLCTVTTSSWIAADRVCKKTKKTEVIWKSFWSVCLLSPNPPAALTSLDFWYGFMRNSIPF